MIILFGILAAVVVVALIAAGARLAPRGSERVRNGPEPAADRQGAELSPRDRAA